MMKMRIRKAIALAMILVMVLSMSAAFAEKRTPSKPFKLPTVQQPATEAPAEDTETEAPAEEPEVPAETEAPAEEPEVPAATEAPAEEPEAPVETEAPETVIATAYVVLADANSTLNVRAAATTDSERLGSLAHGDQVSVVGYEGDWTKIVFGDGYGYVKSSFLSSEAPSTEPEVEPTEEPVVEPTEEPVVEPTEEPVVEATEEPVVEPTEEPVEEFEAYTAYVSLQYESSSLNIRKSASEKAKVVGYLYHGDVVTVLGVEGEWTKVDANGVVGYVYSSFLTTTPPVVEEPEVEATEEPVVEPTEEPVVEPTEEPVVEATEEPVVEPTEEPEVEATEEPVVEPTEEPEVEATEEPVAEPTEEPEVEEPVVEETEEEAPEYLTDEEGNIIYDLNGDPIPAGDYMYNEEGSLIFGEDGKPVPAKAVEVIEIDTEGLRPIVIILHEGETHLNLYAEPSTGSEVLAEIPAGEMLYVKDIEAEWSYAVYGLTEGYVQTDKIALYNADATPEEEEIIRTISLSSNVDGAEVVYKGTEIVLSVKLTGFENDYYAVQWQYSADGETFKTIEGATGENYAFIINDENAGWLWKVNVTILEPEFTAHEIAV